MEIQGVSKTKRIKDILTVLCGNAILAFCIVAFVEPTNIICGGTAGVGLSLQHCFSVPVWVTVCILNVLCFLLGYFVLGKTFALETALSTFLFPAFLNYFEHMKILSYLTNDMLLSAILAGTVSGIGVGIVIKAGASTGGLDIPPLVAKKLFNIPVSAGMMFLNCFVLVLQVPFSDVEHILYGLVNTVLMSLVLNRILLFGTQQVQLLIISPRYDEIRKKILMEDNGVTLVRIETGMTNTPQKAVLCVIPPRKLSVVKKCVLSVDAGSFIMINMITEVRGSGFSFARGENSLESNVL